MPEIRGVWIANRPHSKVLESRQNIAEAMEFLQQMGFNLVCPVVWNRGYTLFPSEVMKNYDLPQIDPFYAQQQRNPLAEIIQEAHQRNIAVIPWFEYGFAASHLANGGHILQKYPEWAAIDCQGEILKQGALVWLNAFNSVVQKFILELVLEVATNYDVEGIQGCDRLPALPVTGGYDRATCLKYQADFGKKPPQDPKNKQWIRWRASILTNFLAQLYTQVKAVKPELMVSLSPAVYPFCLNNLLQDTKTWVLRGIVDLIHPQIYRSSYSAYYREVKKIEKTFSSFSKDRLTLFAPGIALKANNQVLKQEDLIKCIKLNQQMNFSGQIIFHYESLCQNQNKTVSALVKSGGYDRPVSFPHKMENNERKVQYQWRKRELMEEKSDLEDI
ncbi:MAG: glycoside hydrolase family 10 protein [Xenococcaceae cyanobacterium]